MDPRHRRPRARFVLFLLALPLATACEVVDVVANLGNDYVDEPPKKTVAAAPRPGQPQTNAQARLKAYYNRRAKEAEPEDPSNPIVPCKMGSSTQFLRLHDCELRGGSPS